MRGSGPGKVAVIYVYDASEHSIILAAVRIIVFKASAPL